MFISDMSDFAWHSACKMVGGVETSLISRTTLMKSGNFIGFRDVTFGALPDIDDEDMDELHAETRSWGTKVFDVTWRIVTIPGVEL